MFITEGVKLIAKCIKGFETSQMPSQHELIYIIEHKL
jgi:hypothetical protein